MAKSDKEKQVREQSGGSFQIAVNRRARHEYELGQAYEAGIALIGSEVKALRGGSADLSDAWVEVDARGEAWVRGLRISMLQHAAYAHEERRPRKLLLHREEIDKLRNEREREGATLIATKLYFRNNRAKLELCVARGKKLHDKRQALKERDAEKEARAAMARARRY